MAQKLETKFKNRIRPLLEKIPNCFVIKIQQTSIRGDPDFVLCIRGRFVALELKKDLKEMAMLLQEYKLNKITKAGGISFVVCPETWETVYKILRGKP